MTAATWPPPAEATRTCAAGERARRDVSRGIYDESLTPHAVPKAGRRRPVRDRQRVLVVVVTWNRRSLLAESLRALMRQSVPPDGIVVVDNASTDGTGDLLREQFHNIDTVTATRNIGGAGGFALGVDRALELGCDAIWLLDDDTVAEPTALQALLEASVAYPAGRPVLVASRVVWTDGRDHPMNTPRAKPGARATERRAAASVGCLPIRSASFVSVLVEAETVRKKGLPMADYFLWNDDFEFTTRLIRGRRALYCPSSVVVHRTATFGSTDADPGERFFYEVRNKVWLFGRSGGLNPVEKAVYAASTLRRWARTVARSDDRATLRLALRRGLAAGVRSAPRPTAEIMASATGAGANGAGDDG
ncbi:MAG: glycosyltransferase family 2 protein [Propionibacteriales bacterium]|nr:glycosyltransferase family 2 protein [Propionibacteriales bacterium]